MWSRYFKHVTGFTGGDDPDAVIEVREDGRRFAHRVDGIEEFGNGNVRSHRLEVCEKRVQEGKWKELTYREAFPQHVPQTTYEDIW